MGLFCPASNDHDVCPMTTRGPPPMSSWFGLNAVMLLGSALGLMNSSASWRPWMQGLGGHSGETGEGGGGEGSGGGAEREEGEKPSTRKRSLP